MLIAVRLKHKIKGRSRKRPQPAHKAPQCGAQAVEKVEHSWAFSHLYGKISMGDERCLNEGSWIVES